MEELDELQEFRIDTAVYTTRLTAKFINRKKWVRPNPNEVYSYIPGNIIEIFVKEGQELKEGESLLLLEAMKMRNDIKMPFDGKIKKVFVKEGQHVPNKFLMIEIE